MSGNLPPSSDMCEMYAAVDLSKKKRNLDKTSGVVSSESDTPIYTPIDKSKRTLEKSDDYTKLSSSRLETSQVQPVLNQETSRDKTVSRKWLALYFVVAIFAVLVCITFVVLFIILFLRVSALELKESNSEISISSTASVNITQPVSMNYPNSCSAIVQQNLTKLSGYYLLRSSTGEIVSAYCDTTRTCNGVDGGWMRVARLDVNSCPSPLMPKSYRNEMFDTCVVKKDAGGCTSLFYHVFNVPYSKICGRVRAYQVGTLDGFRGEEQSINLNSNYLDGISITVNSKHIWSFAAGDCNCINETLPILGHDWMCDKTNSCPPRVLCVPPLWNIQQCSTSNTWFKKNLQEITASDIEVRICRDQNRDDEDIALETLELYIQ